MASNFCMAARRGPDILMEELVKVLLGGKSMEFKKLFLTVHAAMKSKQPPNGGEEILRLRTYDKLQNLVLDGNVTKTGKRYLGVRSELLQLTEKLAALRRPRERTAGFSPPGGARRKVAEKGPRRSR